jgi:hypothetical protein
MKRVTQRIVIGKTGYIVNVFMDGLKLSSHLESVPEKYLVCEVSNGNVISFIELFDNCIDQEIILSTYGTTKQINKLKKHFCITNN